jgi:hypothetical protein
MLINQDTPTEVVDNEKLITVDNSYWVDMNESLKRLLNNEDFNKVIMTGYFKDKAVKGVSMLAQEHVKRSGARGDVMEALVAISHLEDYFITIRNIGSIPQSVNDEE